jgi:hypothetical protein
MNIDKASFLLALGTIAAGGAGGYFVRDRELLKVVPPSPAGMPEQQAISGAASAASSPSQTPAPRPPICDDMAGAPGACPPPGYPAEEGGCGVLPTKRCEDFKQAMKPRVAEHAVACLNSLNSAQRCDPNRVNLCAHAALMSACSEVDAPVAGGPVAVDDVGARCEAIVQGCAGISVAPTTRDCRATLAGLSVFGRDQVVACMRTHCADKGLVGCEAATDAK